MRDKPKCRRCGGPAGGAFQQVYCIAECEKPNREVTVDLSWDTDELTTSPGIISHAQYKCGYCLQPGVYELDAVASGLRCACGGVLWLYP